MTDCSFCIVESNVFPPQLIIVVATPTLLLLLTRPLLTSRRRKKIPDYYEIMRQLRSDRHRNAKKR